MSRWTRRIARLTLAAAMTMVALVPLPAGADHASAADAGVFISEYLDGALGDRALELYNATGDAVDLAAEGYQVETHFRMQFGDFVVEFAWPVPLTGVVPAGGTYVVVFQGAHPDLVALADQSFGGFPWDGDDVVMLTRGGAVVDAMGTLGVVPPAGNAMDDVGLRRLPHVTEGDGDPHDAFDASLEWSTHPNDDWSDLGQHTVASGTCAPVVGKGVVIGQVCATVSGGIVSVVWEVDEGWTLRSVALAVEADPAAVPQSKGSKGSTALPNKFPHRADLDGATTATLMTSAPDTGGADLVVAAAADVVHADGVGVRGWGHGTAFADHPNSGSWFTLAAG